MRNWVRDSRGVQYLTLCLSHFGCRLALRVFALLAFLEFDARGGGNCEGAGMIGDPRTFGFVARVPVGGRAADGKGSQMVSASYLASQI